MRAFKRNGSPSWYADLVDPMTGERKRTSLNFTGSKAQADKLAAQKQLKLDEEAKLTENGKKPITALEATERYIDKLASNGKVYAKELTHTRAKLFGLPSETPKGSFMGPKGSPKTRWSMDRETLLHDLTPALMEDLVIARTKEGKKPQTIKHEIGLLRSAARYVSRLGYRTPAAMEKGDNPWMIPEVGQKTRYLSQAEYQQVYDFLDPDRPVTMTTRKGGTSTPYLLPSHIRGHRREVQDLLVALAYTGGRWNEVASLTWSQWTSSTAPSRSGGTRPNVKDWCPLRSL
jgi:integrase